MLPRLWIPAISPSKFSGISAIGCICVRPQKCVHADCQVRVASKYFNWLIEWIWHIAGELGTVTPLDLTPCTASKLIAWCLTWGSLAQLRRPVVLVDQAAEDLAPLDRQVQRRAGLVVVVGWSLLAGLVRAVL